MGQLLFVLNASLALAGFGLFWWGIYTANSAYLQLRQALENPALLSPSALQSLPPSLSGYLVAAGAGIVVWLIAQELARVWHKKYGAPAWPPRI